jgi:hypothetical protein
MATNPKLIVIDVMPVANGNNTVTLTLACATQGIVVDGGKNLKLKDQGKPLYFLLKLVPATGFKFLSSPKDAAWFAEGNSPHGPGNAHGHFDPEAVSGDRDLLLVHAHGGKQGTYYAMLNFEDNAPAPVSQTAGGTTLMAAVKSGGPIIIND